MQQFLQHLKSKRLVAFLAYLYFIYMAKPDFTTLGLATVGLLALDLSFIHTPDDLPITEEPVKEVPAAVAGAPETATPATPQEKK